MSEHVIDPAVVQQLCPAFGLLPDIGDLVWRRQSDWRLTALTAVPPAEVAALHDPFRFNRLWERLLAVVREPVREVRVADTRYVQVCGTAVFVIAADGTITPFLWTFEALGRSILDPMPDETVAVQGMPYRDIWMDLMAYHAGCEIEAEAIEQGLVAEADQSHRYAHWAFDQFRRHLRRHADLRQMRRRVTRALRLDPWVLKIAARLPRTTMPVHMIVIGAYNRVIRHRAAFESLQNEAPNLVPIFGALCERAPFPDAGEPAARLKDYLMDQTMLTPRAWRMIAKSGPRMLQPLTEFYRDDPEDAVIAHLHFLALLDLPAASPAWLVRLVLAKWGDRDNRWPSYWADLWPQVGVWQDVVKMIKDRQPEATLLAEFDHVQRWVTRQNAPNALTKHQRRGGWPLLVRQAQAWLDRCEREARDDLNTWPTPFATAQVGGWTVVALRSPYQLWEEAMAMRHCVDAFSGRCESGQTLVVSARQGERRVATAEFQLFDEGWQFIQAKGFANTSAPLRLEAQLSTWARGLTGESRPPSSAASGR